MAQMVGQMAVDFNVPGSNPTQAPYNICLQVVAVLLRPYAMINSPGYTVPRL